MKKLLVMTVVVLAVSVSANAALVTNGGFENGGAMTGWWTPADATIIIDNGPSAVGSYAGRVAAGSDGALLYHPDKVAVTAGEEYTYSFDWKADTITAGWFWWHVRFFDASDGFTGEAISNIGDGNIQNTWQTLTGSIVAPAGSVKADFYFEDGNVGSTGGGLIVDNFSMVPEPMTLSLLGLGGLMLRRRHK